MHALWREVCEIDALKFVVPDEFIRVENARGERLSIYSNLDRMEAKLLQKAPAQGDPMIPRTRSSMCIRFNQVPDYARYAYRRRAN